MLVMVTRKCKKKTRKKKSQRKGDRTGLYESWGYWHENEGCKTEKFHTATKETTDIKLQEWQGARRSKKEQE